MGSPLRSPLRETHPNPSLPLPLPPPDSVPTLAVKLTPIPLSPSPPHSPPRPTPTPPRTPTPPPPPPSAAIVVNRATRDDPTSVTKVEQGTRGIGDGGDRGSKVVSGIMRRSRKDATVRSAGVGVRVSAAVLSLISFSVMAADKTKGWAGDSFDRYKEYRYCISVNIITFIYSSFQAFIQVNQMIKGKHFIRPPLQYYFDLALDQILAYLLISASSSAATRNDDWVSNWGKDPFTIMINGSISMSFLAFVALAISSLISAYALFSRST